MGKKLFDKKMWAAGDVVGVYVSDGVLLAETSGIKNTGAEYGRDDFAEGVIWDKKPRKIECTYGGEYPDAWPPKRIRILIEEVD